MFGAKDAAWLTPGKDDKLKKALKDAQMAGAKRF